MRNKQNCSSPLRWFLFPGTFVKCRPKSFLLLVGGLNQPLWNIFVKMGSSSPIFGWKFQKWLSCHQPEILSITSVLHPWKLTCPKKMDYFSRECIFQPLIFRGHVSFQGSNLAKALIKFHSAATGRMWPRNETTQFVPIQVLGGGETGRCFWISRVYPPEV